MSRRVIHAAVILAASLLCNPAGAETPFAFEIESGYVAAGYNDVRIPGAGGTDISLVDDLDTEGSPYVRILVRYAPGGRHNLSALYAPLSLDADGSVDREITFESALFAPGTPLAALYRFNSYRLTYRYDFYEADRFEMGFGVTAKIRDAEVRLSGGGVEAAKTNVGFVPLLHFMVNWRPVGRLGLVVEGDALAAPQGRAEDLLAALTLRITERVGMRLGYRLLEGGADNDEVYNFALLHYAAAGLTVRF